MAISPKQKENKITLYKNLVNGLGAIAFIINPTDRKIIACSKLAADFYGFKPDKLLGLPLEKLQASSSEKINRHLANISSGKSRIYKTQHIIKSGTTADVEVSDTAINVDGEVLILSIITNLSPKKKTEKKLMQTISLLEKFFYDNTLPILMVESGSFEIIEANRCAQNFFGLSADELKNKSLASLSTLTKEHFNKRVSDFVAKGYTGLEITFTTKNKGKKDIDLHYTLVKILKRELLLFVLVDITERNQALGAVSEIKNNLSEEVKKQTASLVNINNSLLEQISRRKAVENDLLESQQMFSHLFQLNPNGIILRCLVTGKIVEVNQSFLSTFGLSKTDVIGKSIEELNILCDRECFYKDFKELLNSKEALQFPTTMMSEHGHVKFVIYSGEIIKLTKGDFVLEVFQDITEMQITQQKLAENEERYRSMFNNALVGIYRSETETGIVLSSNRQFAKMLGYKNENEIVGKSILGHYKSDSTWQDFTQKLKTNNTCVMEFELTSKNKKRIWVVNYARILTRENLIDGVMVDITDRKLMENLLTNNERRFRSMIENASDIILIVDSDGKIQYLSPSIQKELGYPIENPQNPNMLDFLHSKDKPRVAKLLKSKQSKRVLHHVKVLNSNGVYRIYEFTATNLTHDNSVGGIIINGHDITDQVKAKEELNIALEKEQELSRQKSQFISTVSHEFRTPLTNISLNIQLLNKYIQEEKNNNSEQVIARLTNAVKRLTALLNEISLISKDQSGRLLFTPEKQEVHGLINELLDQISYLLLPNVEVVLNIGASRTVNADKNLLVHILNNLLSNAIKYSKKEGYIQLAINVLENNILELLVKDKGIGIPESELEFLFNPYFRASNVTSVSGSGLGLSITKRCVDLHNGSLTIKSKLGKGTEVSCKIPLK